MKRFYFWLFFAALVFFAAASLLWLDRVPFKATHETEAGMLVSAAMDAFRNGRTFLFFLRFVEKGLCFDSEYCGRTGVLLILPFTRVLGLCEIGMRLPFVLASLGTLASVFYVLRRWFGDMVAAVAAALLAVDPIFVIYTRRGVDREEILVVFFFWAALAMREFFAVRRRNVFLFAAAFLSGVGLWTKFSFACYLFGAAAALVLSGRGGRETLRRACGGGKMLWSAFFFLLGAFPLVYRNLSPRHFMVLPLHLLGKLIHGNYGYDNLSFLHNLAGRCVQLFEILSMRGGAVNAWIVAAAGAVVVWDAFFSRARAVLDRRILRGVLIFYAVNFVLTIFVPSFPSVEHLFLLWPLPQLLCACVVFLCYCRTTGSPAFRGALAAVAAVALMVMPAFGLGLYLDDARRGKIDNDASFILALAKTFKTLPRGRTISNNNYIAQSLSLELSPDWRPYILSYLEIPEPFMVRQARYIVSVPHGIEGFEGFEVQDRALNLIDRRIRARGLELRLLKKFRGFSVCGPCMLYELRAPDGGLMPDALKRPEEWTVTIL